MRRHISFPDAPDFSHLQDRFFWMMWEMICMIEATQFENKGWSML